MSLSFQSECFSDPLQKLKHFNRFTSNIDVFALFNDSAKQHTRTMFSVASMKREPSLIPQQVACANCQECALPRRPCTPTEALMYQRKVRQGRSSDERQAK